MQEMEAKHQQMMEEMKKMNETLQQKVDAMNAATGEQKVNAMADVINELVKERKAMYEHMAEMHKNMGNHMMMGHMGGMHGGAMHDMGTTGTMSGSRKRM
jgi:NADH dehydrogenase/NADH:ubiquinone oxidoreductase subunit G